MRLFIASLAFCLSITIPAFAQYSLTVESAVPVGDTTPGMVYRFYVHTDDASDKLSAVYGSDSSPLVINTPDGIYNSAAAAGPSAEGLSDFLLGFFPEIADDSYATVNLTGAAASSGIVGAAAPQVIEDPALSNGITDYFTGSNDGTLLEVNTLIGGSWFLTGAEGNASPDSDGRWLVAQVTTAGEISGSINVQVFSQGILSEANEVRKTFNFVGVGEFVPEGFYDCTDSTACNFDPAATDDDGSCEYIAEGACDCDGNEFDALGVCGGLCEEDVNANGICDEEDVYGCMIDLACNYNPEATFSDASCDFTSCLAFGCNDSAACNFDPEAVFNDGSCVYAQPSIFEEILNQVIQD